MKFVRVSEQLERTCQNKILETISKCQPNVGKTIPVPVLRFRQLGRTAGMFYSPRWKTENKPLIVINPDFFKNHYDDMVNDTVPHEACHYVTFFAFGPKHGHDSVWKMTMKWAGIPAAERCHQYDLEGVKHKTFDRPFKYTCSCKEFWLTHRIHNSIQRDGRWRKCLKCKVKLTYQGRKVNGSLYVPATPVKHVEVVKTLVIPARPVVPVSIIPPLPPQPKVIDLNPLVNKTKVDSGFKTVTVFQDGVLQNIRVPA